MLNRHEDELATDGISPGEAPFHEVHINPAISQLYFYTTHTHTLMHSRSVYGFRE